MGDIADEFDFLIEEEVESNKSERKTTFEDDSNACVVAAKQFLDNAKASGNRTYQGIPMGAYVDSITLGESDIVPWNHVKFTLDVAKLKNLGNNMLEELIIPTFVEELESIGDKAGTEFGFNQAGRNRLKYIEIPQNVIVIAPSTFAFYKKLETINFKENSKLIYLGSQTFVGCELLHTLDLSNCEDLDEIKNGTFDGSAIQVLKLNSNISKMCNIVNTDIKTVYIDDTAYSRQEFIQLVRDTKDGAFWIEAEYNF